MFFLLYYEKKVSLAKLRNLALNLAIHLGAIRWEKESPNQVAKFGKSDIWQWRWMCSISQFLS